MSLSKLIQGCIDFYQSFFSQAKSLLLVFFFITELSSNMPISCTSGIKFALIEVICNLPSLRSSFLSHPHSLQFSPRFLNISSVFQYTFSSLLPPIFNRKTNYSGTCVKHSPTGNDSVTASYRLTAMPGPQNTGIMKNNKENVILCHYWPFYVPKLPHKYN